MNNDNISFDEYYNMEDMVRFNDKTCIVNWTKRETGKEYKMSKMTLNRAVKLANELCLKLDCRKCPIYEECSQFARVHKSVPTMYIQNQLNKENKNGKI